MGQGVAGASAQLHLRTPVRIFSFALVTTRVDSFLPSGAVTFLFSDIERDPAGGLQSAENVAAMMEAAQVPNGIAHAHESAGWANLAIGEIDAAKAAYATAIDAFESIPNDHCLACHCLEGCVHIALQSSAVHDAAELWGAVEKWRENISVVPMPVEQSLGNTEELLRASMEPEALEAARSVGREFDRDQTLATARAIITN